MRTLFRLAASLFLVAVSFVPASAKECTCRARNVIAMLGETVCLNTPTGARLAQCVMVLNNPSWSFLEGQCPQASRANPDLFAALTPAAQPELLQSFPQTE